jgi:hypothetical protein
VRENAPVDWGEDAFGLLLKKVIKRALATRFGWRLVMSACSITESLAPDSKLNRRAYETAVGVAIFRGVREGLKRYGSDRLDKTGTVEFGKALR